MAKVIAISKGYFGGVIREVGDKFEWPDDMKLGSWVTSAAFGGKGDHDGDGKPGGSKPDDADKKPAQAKADGDGKPGKNRKGKPETVQAAEAEPFADAPAPSTTEPQGNGVAEALGIEPDWVPPGSDAPVMADE